MKTAKPATRKELTEQTFHLISAIQNMSNAIIDLNQRVEKLEAPKAQENVFRALGFNESEAEQLIKWSDDLIAKRFAKEEQSAHVY